MNCWTRWAALSLAVAAACAGQQPKTNFSGHWRMLKTQSNFANFAMPDSVVRIVTQHGIAMNVHTVETIHGKTNISDIVYYTDGRVTQNIINGNKAESRTFWDGPELMVRTVEKNAKGQEIEMLDDWQLSPDGNLLTTTSHVTTAKGSVDLKLVCVKEKPG